jgi:hypothetical protein
VLWLNAGTGVRSKHAIKRALFILYSICARCGYRLHRSRITSVGHHFEISTGRRILEHLRAGTKS